ncbi:MAG: oligosaccharide repeat unit polymerase [Chloroflexi bacterium]|nr:oligosaccharide repeat unit polymerase [Ardenticatenaceae bacterium]NOG34166.1 oligosaccharide repeat unit polymerase [Chloroflexota bacterium]
MDFKKPIMPKKSIRYLLLFIATLAGLLTSLNGYADLLWAMVILLVCSLLLFVSHRLYNLANWIDPVIMFIVSYVTFVVVGIIGTKWFNLDLHAATLIAVLLGLTVFLGGALFADLLASPHRKLRLKRLVMVDYSYSQREFWWAWFFFLIGFFFLLIYYALVGTIPFLAENAESLRVGAVGGLGYLLIAGFAFLNVSTTFLVGMNAKRRKAHFLLVAGGLLITTSLLLVGVGYRMPAVRVMLSGFIVYHFIRYAHIPKRSLGILILTLIILLGVAGFYRLYGQFLQTPADIEFTLRRTIWSIFVRYLYVLDLVVRFFPEDHAYLYGSSYLISAQVLLPGTQQHFGYWLVEKMGLILSSPGPVDPTIVGEFYANFGWVGIVLGMSLLGFVLRASYRRLINSQTITIARLIFISLISTSIIGIAASGVVLVLMFDLLPIIIVFALYQLCVRLRVVKTAPRRKVAQI